jgi:hypothetical protein
MEKKTLHLRFHGRIIEHLGIQIYQRPVNAIAEMVSNAWDGDAERVKMRIPSQLSDAAVITISDDGIGMTFDECQKRYLNVGWNRRGANPDERSVKKKRPILGRKGIGKFAGFGIARTVEINTIAESTGERTVFKLDLDDLLSDEYVGTEAKTITVSSYRPPNKARRAKHGTTVTLSHLKLTRIYSADALARSMARRFLLHQGQADFCVLINGKPLPTSVDLEGVEYVFPKDYKKVEKPGTLEAVDADRWGTEKISRKAPKIRWRFIFHKDPIEEEELRGIAVFAKGKMAQSPFLFNLTGGLGGQHGVEYLSGQVQADFLDALPEDIIATERLRINWEHPAARPLAEWGRKRVKELLRVWRQRRGEHRVRELEGKVARFAWRLDAMESRERLTVKKALRKLAQVPALSGKQFEDLGQAILTAFEQGRLRELITAISKTASLSEKDLLKLLLEAQVLTALNVAEAVKTKLLTVAGLKDRIDAQQLELGVRDYIAKHPWLISPEWDTYKIESSVKGLVKSAAESAELTGEKWKGRVDLVLGSGYHLLILEFMRPGLKIDWDHIQRFERYVRIVRTNLAANTGGRFQEATGYIVADALEKDATVINKIGALAKEGMYALDWPTLFNQAMARWREFLETLATRAPRDKRLMSLLE